MGDSTKIKAFSFLLSLVCLFSFSEMARAEIQPACEILLATPFLQELKETLPAAYSNLKTKTVRKVYLWWMKQKDQSKDAVERRPKFLTVPGPGQEEKSDPTAPVSYVKQNGQKYYSIRNSPQYIEAHSLDQILRGGAKNITKQKMRAIKLEYADGTILYDPEEPEKFKDYGAWSTWDNYLVAFPKRDVDGEIVRDHDGNAVIEKYVGYAGTMIQPYKLKGDTTGKKLPDFGGYNHTRSRHAYDVRFEEGKNGKLIEVWTDRGSIFQGEPSTSGMWIEGDFAHGYGSRILTDENGFPWLDQYGYYWMVYDRVTEQKEYTHEDGTKFYTPYKTEIRARRMKDPFTAFKPGELMLGGEDASQEIHIADVAPYSVNGDKPPFLVTDRGYDGEGHHLGYLEEGLNPAVIKIQDSSGAKSKFWIGLSSAGNFTDDAYSVELRYRKYEDGPLGLFQPVLDQNGQPVSFGKELQSLGIHWGFARADFFYDELGQGWLIGHGLLKDDVPKGLPLSGWPKPDQWHNYRRQDILLPVSWVLKDGVPWLQIETPPIPEEVIEAYFLQKHSR